MTKQAVIFDYNGVLVGDEHLQYQAMEAVLARYGGTLTPEIYNEYLLGRPDRAGLEALQAVFPALQEKGVAELVKEKVGEYRMLLAEQSIIYPVIPDLLSQLHTHYTIGVVTGSLEPEVVPVLEKADVLKYFDCVVTADQVTRGKPDPEGYLKGAAELGISPEEIVVIEDTPAGVAAAKSAGMKCIALEHTVDASQLQEADMIVATISDVTVDMIVSLLA